MSKLTDKARQLQILAEAWLSICNRNQAPPANNDPYAAALLGPAPAMAPTEAPRAEDRLQTDQEIHQNVRQLQRLGGFKLHPGQKLYEMILVPLAGEAVLGLDPETGAFDPELALVREVPLDGSVVVFTGDPYHAGLGGKVKSGGRRRYKITDGNIYEAAINPENARRKIISKYF